RSAATLFPYTTLFRSAGGIVGVRERGSRSEHNRAGFRPIDSIEAVEIRELLGPDSARFLLGRSNGHDCMLQGAGRHVDLKTHLRSEEHTSELQSRSDL